MDHEFQQLRQLFAQGLVNRYQRIEAAIQQLEEAVSTGHENPVALRELHKEVHNLAGAAGGYQFEQLSRKSRALERMLSQQQSQEGLLGEAQWPQLHQEVMALLALIQQERQVA